MIGGGENGGKTTRGFGRNLRAMALSMFVKQRMTFFVSSESRTYIDPLGKTVITIGSDPR